MRVPAIILMLFSTMLTQAESQVAIHPTRIQPAAWERIAVRVVNQTDVATIRIHVDVPEALDILGVQPLLGWQFSLVRATDSTPQHIDWTAGSLSQWQFQEFAFYARTGPDVREKELIFPVTLTKEDGTLLTWNNRDGSSAPAPRMQIVGSTEISNWGAFAIAAAAMGLSFLSIALAASRKREATR